MKLVLQKDVKGTGKKGDIVNVNDGYAQNFLIPNKLAIIANSSNVNVAKQQKISQNYQQEQIRLTAVELAKQIEKCNVVIPVKVGDNGKIFGSVTSSEIVNEINKNGFSIDKKKIELLEPIKTLGTFSVKIKLHPTVVITVNVNVIAQ